MNTNLFMPAYLPVTKALVERARQLKSTQKTAVDEVPVIIMPPVDTIKDIARHCDQKQQLLKNAVLIVISSCIMEKRQRVLDVRRCV